MSQNGQLVSSGWIFYSIGIILVILGIVFFLIPLFSRTVNLSNLKIPWILLYVYSKDGFYFATSPILIILSVAAVLFYIIRR